MMKSLVFSLFILQLLVLNIPETSAKCTLSEEARGLLMYTCEGGKLSDLDAISSDAQYIYITGMVVQKFPANTLNRFSGNLAVFQCSHCGIAEIESAPFKSLTNLQQLMLDNNELTSIRPEWFIGLEYLFSLDLSSNKIKNIESGAFGDAKMIDDLRLSGNPLDCLDPKALTNLTQLTRVEIGDIPNFKCPRALSQYLKARGIEFEVDKSWDMAQVEKVSNNIYVTSGPRPTDPTPIATTPVFKPTKSVNEYSKPGETLAPTVESEDVDITALQTTISIPKPLNTSAPNHTVVESTTPMAVEKPVQASTENIDVATVVQPGYPVGPSNILNVTDTVPPTTGPVEITAPQVPEIFVPGETTKPPIIAPPVKPTSGEEPVIPPVSDISTPEKAGNNTESQSPNEHPADSGLTGSLHNAGARPNRVEEYFLTMFVVAFYRSFL